MADLLSIGLSGLKSSQNSLTVTGHNIANVNTAGYSRQSAVQQTNIAQFSGSGYIGSGSQTTDVRRLANDFLTSNVRTATSSASELSSFYAQISQLDSLLSDTTTGVSPALQSFFTAVQTASQDPTSTAAREALLAQAQGLSKTFNTLYDQLDTQNKLINQQLGSLTNQVNSLASSVAGYNEAIAKAKSAGASPNDLIDARDETIRQLSELVGVQVVTPDDNSGSVSLFIGTGQPLVVGTTTSQLSVSPSKEDPSKMQVNLVSGSFSQNVSTQISGGEIGGLLAYRDTALDTTYNSLGQVALAVADTVNSQLGQGLDLAGAAGVNLFTDINDTQTAKLRVLAQSGNVSAATGALSITDTSKLGASDYTLEYTGNGQWSARRSSDNAAMTVNATGNAPPYTLTFTDANGVDQGFSLSMDALPADGDKFTLQPTRRASSTIGTTGITANQIALAGSAKATTGANNVGSGVISQPGLLTSSSSPVVLSELNTLFGSAGTKLTYNATTGVMDATPALPNGATLSYVSPSTTGITTGQTNTLQLDYTDPVSGNSYSYQFTLSGVPQGGDSFNLAFNDNAVSDNRNGLNLSALQTATTVNNTTYNSSYSGLVERVGTLTAQVSANSDAATAVLSQAQDSRDSLSGVNLDEEAANLVQFQQYYSANAQVISVARSLFDTLIGAFN